MRPFLATASRLFALVLVVTTQSAHAQDGPESASANQESVTSNPQSDEPGTEPVSDAQSVRTLGQNRCFTRLGVLVVPYHSSATIAANGQLLSGGRAKARNNMTLTFDLGCEITKNFSVSVTTGIPPKPHITGEGAAASLGMLGKVRYGPAFFTGYYRFPKTGPFRPYLGGGAAYAIIFKEFDGSVKNLQVHNHWGSVLQGGVSTN